MSKRNRVALHLGVGLISLAALAGSWGLCAAEGESPPVPQNTAAERAAAEETAGASGPEDEAGVEPASLRIPVFYPGVESGGAAEAARELEMIPAAAGPIWVGRTCEELLPGVCLCTPDLEESCNPISCGSPRNCGIPET